MKILFGLSLILLLVSCSKDLELNQSDDLLLEDKILSVGEEDFFLKGTHKGYYIISGDQIIFPADLDDFEQMVHNSKNEVQLRGATSSNKWPCNEVSYKFNSNLSATKRNQIIAAFDIIKSKTNLKFKYAARFAPRSSYVLIEQINGNAGLASVGKTSCPLMQIGSSANMRAVLHEVGHVVGLHHEHQRADGEDYLDYFKENVRNSQWDIIKPLSYATPRGEMDFRSVMMYPSCAGAKNQGSGFAGCANEDASFLKSNGVQVTVNNGATDYSSGDVNAMNDLYNTNIDCGGGSGDHPVGDEWDWEL